MNFPSLDILSPARLYSDSLEPCGSNVPFTDNEGRSHEQARRVFLMNTAKLYPGKPCGS